MDRWLKCKVLKGMFSDERAVVVHRRGNGSVQFFVPASSTRGDEWVRVKVFSRSDGSWAEMPTPQRDSVPIAPEEIVS